jgi:hydroxyacylglutathione hydrolase
MGGVFRWLLTAAEFENVSSSVPLVDVRSASAFLGAHLPDCLALPADMIAAFACWRRGSVERFLPDVITGGEVGAASSRELPRK